MNKLIVRAPVRADLAGGTLDLWPLYLFHPGSRTVNVAVSFYAESEVSLTGDGAIEIHLTDQQYRQRYESMQELSADPKAALIYRLVEHFHLNGLSITTRTDAPRGSGLGGSSALSITLVRALSQLAGTPIEGEDLIFLVRDLETRLLGVPAGIQDYYPPVFGGLASLRLEPGAPKRHPINIPVADLASHMLLHYSGVQHFSGTNNWEMYKKQIDGKKKVQRGFDKIAKNSIDMEKALEAGDFEKAGSVLAKEWESRKALIDGISTPEIEAAIDAALSAGAWGGKVCGAGGGGCIVFLFPPENREAIVAALGTVPGRVLDAAPVAHGMMVRGGEDEQFLSSPGRPRTAASRRDGEVEQLYVHGDRGEYKPFILAEAVVKHIEGRSGTHRSVIRSYVAPIEDIDGRVLWHLARPVELSQLDLRVVPDPERRVNSSIRPETVLQRAMDSEESFRTFLGENERLHLLHNAAFAIYSEANETRHAFGERCLDEANRRLADKTEGLESTFRRRIDQLREKSEREQRDREKEGETPADRAAQDVNVAWGQALYNITSGRPAAVAEATPSVREVDYLENIAQIQRAWEKELQALRDDVMAKAYEVEEITIAPPPKNIEVTKYLVLWAGKQP
ncbi:MAG: GHMP family kinase ATP-binding protein [Thermoanaerobaculia bacterium]